MQTTSKIFVSIFLICLLSAPIAVGQTPQPPTEAVTAMNAALQALKESKWKQADESFDLVLMFAPKYAPAHIGKLCAELKLTEEKLLGNIDPPVAIDEHRLFKAAIESADPAYKKQIQGYADSINAKLKTMVASIPKDDRKARERTTLTIKGVEYAFRWCPAGTFMMGSPQNEANRRDSETQHQVILSRGFWMLETEVTQGMWASVMGNNPSSSKGIKLPVECVSWDDCQEYIKKLNGMKVAPAGFKFSLPTEAQWEYACRAGTTTAYSFGNTLSSEQANFGSETKDVGSYPANAWGLYDMHGNVWELCADWYGEYPIGAVTDPMGADRGWNRVIRGGGKYSGYAHHCRSALRDSNTFAGGREIVLAHMPGDRVGLRLSLVLQ